MSGSSNWAVASIVGDKIGVTAIMDGFSMAVFTDIVGGAGELPITCGVSMLDVACAAAASMGVTARISGVNDADDVAMTAVIKTVELVETPGFGISALPLIVGMGGVIPCTTGASIAELAVDAGGLTSASATGNCGASAPASSPGALGTSTRAPTLDHHNVPPGDCQPGAVTTTPLARASRLPQSLSTPV